MIASIDLLTAFFSFVKNNWFARFIISTYNFVSKTSRNMILIFFNIRSISIFIITFNSFHITFKISINFKANCLK